MNQNSPGFLTQLFALLASNKEFPAYSAERRIDIFVNYFLSRILTAYLNKEAVFVCPEFPLKKENNNPSTRLDYLCATADEILFVELKTDIVSLTGNSGLSQAAIYFNHQWENCLAALPLIVNATKPRHKGKYAKADGSCKATYQSHKKSACQSHLHCAGCGEPSKVQHNFLHH